MIHKVASKRPSERNCKRFSEKSSAELKIMIKERKLVL